MGYKTRIYYKLSITLLSPMSIGSGNSEFTDHDVLVDNNGNPFIPATSIAGVMRSYISSKYGNNFSNTMFGQIAENSQSNFDEKSKVRFYDATVSKTFLNKSKRYISTRDCVKLEHKIGVKGAKFDFQVVETGMKFDSFIEVFEEDFVPYIEEAMAAVEEGIITFGTKTTRGYGKCSLKVKKAVLDNIPDWISFKMFMDDEWENRNYITLNTIEKEYYQFIISLKLRGGLSIREYSTDVGMPDYRTIVLKSTDDYTPIVTGTSWAGAFRSRFKQIMSEQEVSEIFGTVDEKSAVSQKSNIIFSESIIKNGIEKDSTRNSIDRFSGATKAGALYTDKACFYGQTDLVIEVNKSVGEKAISALAVCLADLHNGFLAVGGLTSIGRGLFEIKKVTIEGKELKEFIIVDSVNIAKFVKEAISSEKK